MGNFVQHEPCIACGSRDNFARYDDGGGVCFGCGHWEPPTISGYVAKKQQYAKQEGLRYGLPVDFSQQYSAESVAWIQQYGLTADELLRRGVGFSQRNNQLIFTFYQGEELVLWQARNFTKGRKKYFTAGDKNDVYRVFPTGRCSSAVDSGRPSILDTADHHDKGRRLVIVEDCVSAIKIARQEDSLPCLGATLTNRLIASLRASYGFLEVWLDGNKFDAAQDICRRAQLLGMAARAIWTELDPKEYPDEYITNVLGEGNGARSKLCS